MTTKNGYENTSEDAKHLGSGLLKFRRSTVHSFSSLTDNHESKSPNNDGISKKYTRRYGAAELCINYESDQIWQQNYPDTTDTIQDMQPTSSINRDAAVNEVRFAPGKNTRSLSADEFMKSKSYKNQSQLNISAQSGEGHCSGACAKIPSDIQPLIKQAYADSDFDHVDLSPVYLPMVDDDGILRRTRPETNK